jgi:hypothetical protein
MQQLPSARLTDSLLPFLRDGAPAKPGTRKDGLVTWHRRHCECGSRAEKADPEVRRKDVRVFRGPSNQTVSTLRQEAQNVGQPGGSKIGKAPVAGYSTEKAAEFDLARETMAEGWAVNQRSPAECLHGPVDRFKELRVIAKGIQETPEVARGTMTPSARMRGSRRGINVVPQGALIVRAGTEV